MRAAANPTAIAVFVAMFALVTGVGFFAARWRAGDLTQLHEWGLAGRRFGVLTSWVLIGGDFYTAYAVIAVPAAVYGRGAPGFFAISYAVLVYPIVFVTMPRLWNVCRRHGFITPADFVRGRYGSDALALAVAVTGILATLPYVALQLVGMQAVIADLGIGGSGIAHEAPLVVAFAILAAYTYSSGLRAPAAIAFVKDVAMYAVIIVAVVVIPMRLGGYAAIFHAADVHFAGAARASAGPPAATAGIILASDGYWRYATLALGSALAAFMYPHTITTVLASSSGDGIKRNAVLLPLYTVLFGGMALLGLMAIAAHVVVRVPNDAVPALFAAMFPPWFVGFAFATIAVAALVPAAVMSIAAANLWTRNVYKAYLRPHATPADEARTAKFASLVLKAGALAFIFAVPQTYAIDMQLLGGMWILQTLPAIAGGILTRFFHHGALLAGWCAGMMLGTALSFSHGFAPAIPLHAFGAAIDAYVGLVALALNLTVATGLTFAFDAAKIARRPDATVPADYRG